MVLHRVSQLVLAALVFSKSVSTQSYRSCDVDQRNCFETLSVGDNDLSIGIALPPVSAESPSSEFIGRVDVALEGYGYAGLLFDSEVPRMVAAPFFWQAPCIEPTDPGCSDLVGASNESARVISPRIINGSTTTVFSGPITTLLKGTTQNETHLTTVFRCQHCLGTTFIHPNQSAASSPVSLLLSSFKPQPPQDINAFIPFDASVTVTNFTFSFPKAHFGDYFSRLQPLFD